MEMINLHQKLIELYSEYAAKYKLRHTFYQGTNRIVNGVRRYDCMRIEPVEECLDDTHLDIAVLKFVKRFEFAMYWMDDD